MQFNMIAVRSHTISADGREVTVTVVNKTGGTFDLVMQADFIDGIVASFRRAEAGAQAKRKKQLSQRSMLMPKEIAVDVDDMNSLVCLMFDPGTEMEAGYGLSRSDAQKTVTLLQGGIREVGRAKGRPS
jgi:hypothetical protein